MFYSTVYSATDTSSIFEAQMDFWEFVLLAISLFVLAAGLLSIIFILWWGLLLILSGGKDDKIKPAINTIRFLDVEKYAKPQRIFEKIEEIWDKIFWWSSSSSSFNSDAPQSLDDFPADFSDL